MPKVKNLLFYSAIAIEAGIENSRRLFWSESYASQG